jgi:TP901 family phage tail tape measure protein
VRVPIPVDIKTRLDLDSLSKSGEDLRRSMEQAGGKSAEAYAASFLGGFVRSGAISGFGKLGTDASNEFGKGLKSGITRHAEEALHDLGPLGSGASRIFTGIAEAAGPASLAIAGIGGAGIIALKQLYDLGEKWHEIARGIAGNTGQIGEALENTVKSVGQVGIQIGQPLEDIGAIATKVIQSLHLTDVPLQNMVRNISEFQSLTGQSLDVREFGKSLRVFGLDPAKDGVKALNDLAEASRNTGTPVNSLVNVLESAGDRAKQFHLDFGKTAALIQTFEEAGLPEEKVVTGLNFALKTFAKDGREPAKALADTLREIHDLSQSSDPADRAKALQEAFKTFGSRGGAAEFFDLIKNGKLDVQSLNNELGASPGATDAAGDGFHRNASKIDELYEHTKTVGQEFQSLKNELSVELEPTAKTVFENINEFIKATIENTKTDIEWIHNLGKAWDDFWAFLPWNRGAPGQPLPPGAVPGANTPGFTPGTGAAVPGIPIPGQPGLSGIPAGQGRAGVPRPPGGAGPGIGGAGAGTGAAPGGFSIGPGGAANVGGSTGGGIGSAGATGYSYNPGGGAAQWRGVFSSVLSRMGLPQEPWLSLGLKQLEFESSGNPTAINRSDSNAAAGHPSQGLMQTVPGTFNAYLPPGFAPDITNPESNIAAAINYVLQSSRYHHSPVGVWGEGHGYATGGAVVDQNSELLNMMMGTPGAYMSRVKPPADSDFTAQRLTRTGSFGPLGMDMINRPNEGAFDNPGIFNPGIQIDTSTTSTGAAPGWQRHADMLIKGAQMSGWFSPISPTWNRKIGNWMMSKVNNGFAGGGHPTDTVPAMLTPGEHVLTTDDVKALGGQEGVYRLRSMLKHFDTGGGVPGDVGNDDWLARELRFFKAIGVAGGHFPPGNFNPGMKLDPSRTAISPKPPWMSAPSWAQPSDSSWTMHDLKTIIRQPDRDVNNPVQDMRRKNRAQDPMWQFFATPHPGSNGPHGDYPIGPDYATFFATGGAVPGIEDLLDPNSQTSQLTDSFTGGLAGAGGWGGLAGNIAQMGVDWYRAGHQATGATGTAASGTGSGPAPGAPPVAGNAPAAGSGKGFGGVGGAPLQAASMAASLVPGGQQGMQLANRALAFAGQSLAIGLSAIPQTFLPSGSPLGDPGRSWFGKILGGFSGARPVKENTAGQNQPAMPPPPPPQGTPASGAGTGTPPGPLIGELHYSGTKDDGQHFARDVARQINAHGAGSGR